MVARDARLRAFGNGARFVESGEKMPDLRNAVFQVAVLGAFILGEVVWRVPSPV